MVLQARSSVGRLTFGLEVHKIQFLDDSTDNFHAANGKLSCLGVSQLEMTHH